MHLNISSYHSLKHKKRSLLTFLEAKWEVFYDFHVQPTMIVPMRVSSIQQCLLWRSQLTTRFDCVRSHLQTGGNMLLSKQIYHRQLTNNSVSNVTLWYEPEMGERAHPYLSGTEEHPCNHCGKSQPASVKSKRWKTINGCYLKCCAVSQDSFVFSTEYIHFLVWQRREDLCYESAVKKNICVFNCSK